MTYDMYTHAFFLVVVGDVSFGPLCHYCAALKVSDSDPCPDLFNRHLVLCDGRASTDSSTPLVTAQYI